MGIGGIGLGDGGRRVALTDVGSSYKYISTSEGDILWNESNTTQSEERRGSTITCGKDHARQNECSKTKTKGTTKYRYSTN